LTSRSRQTWKDAMRGGDKQRVSALRLVLSELQKAAKDGSDDELTVLRASASAAWRPRAPIARPAARTSRRARRPRAS